MKKRRAKLTSTPNTVRVREYDAEHPGVSAAAVAKALRLNVNQVYNARTYINQCQKQKHTLDNVLNEKDILAIKRIGVDRAERIVRLFKQLGGA